MKLKALNVLLRRSRKYYPEVWLLTLLAFITRFWNLYTPRQTVFDEVYFKEFPSHYLSGTYYFDVHPPLTKLIFAGVAKIFNYSAQQLNDGSAVLMRIFPAFAGALLVPLFYIFLKKLGASRKLAALGAAAILLENALLVESRFVLMDSWLLLCGLAALTCFLFFLRAKSGAARWSWLTTAGLAGGFCVSTKWTGFSVLAIAGLVLVGRYLNVWLAKRKPNWKRLASELAVLFLIPFAVYTFGFWLHFNLLPKSGPGDAFMSQEFQATLIGSNYNPHVKMNFVSKFLELNRQMYESNKSLNAKHPYSSSWYQWPIMDKPVYYWAGTNDQPDRQHRIYLMGNPFIWLASTLGVLLAAGYFFFGRRQVELSVGFLLLFYLLNLLPFIAIGRVMFLYHYFFSYLAAIATTVMLAQVYISRLEKSKSPKSKYVNYGIASALLVMIIGFVYYAPLSYGTPLSESGIDHRFIIKEWQKTSPTN